MRLAQAYLNKRAGCHRLPRWNLQDEPDAEAFVAGVNGAAGGAGLSIVSAFDLVVAGESAKLQRPTLSRSYPGGTSTYFGSPHWGAKNVGSNLTNRTLSADEAEAWV